MPKQTIEVDIDELEYALTEAIIAIQGVVLKEDKRERVEKSLRDFLNGLVEARNITTSNQHTGGSQYIVGLKGNNEVERVAC